MDGAATMSEFDNFEDKVDAWNNDNYEIDDDEGYHCPDCGWKGFFAELVTDLDEDSIVKCYNCGSTDLENYGPK